ncbi:unnamed protein product [Staurois parvus]|uniref:Secreted protein n=1 Tax=Staurois parvus TaxID=386267 RepID=A0ABN9HJP7_9NEOB|nr:unnamed protein product [Staurois parvus]
MILPTRVCFSSAVPLLSSAFLAAISSAFMAAISSASLSCSSGYRGMLSHLDVIRFSAHRAPYSPCAKNMAALSV